MPGRHPPVRENDEDQSQKSERAAGKGINKEPAGGEAPVVPPPDAHHEKQRNQREFEEDVEQDDVLRGEDTNQPRFQKEH